MVCGQDAVRSVSTTATGANATQPVGLGGCLGRQEFRRDVGPQRLEGRRKFAEIVQPAEQSHPRGRLATQRNEGSFQLCATRSAQ